MHLTSLLHYWIQRFGNMFRVDETLEFKSLHGFNCPTKHLLPSSTIILGTHYRHEALTNIFVSLVDFY